MERAVGIAPQSGQRIREFAGKRFPVFIVIRAIQLGHDVDVDGPRLDLLSQLILGLLPLCGILHGEHVLVGLPERRGIGQKIEILGDLCADLEGGFLQFFKLFFDDSIEQVEVFRNAMCPRILVALLYRYAFFAHHFAIKLAHSFNQRIVNTRNDG